MRFTSCVAAALAVAVVRADVTDDLEDAASTASASISSVAEAATSPSVQKPEFTVSPLCLQFATRELD